jgi:hypothetical protein
MRINEAWHRGHVMPKNATLEERIEWHLEHARHCACRPIPDGLQKEIRQRGGTLP